MDSTKAQPNSAQMRCQWDFRTDPGPRPENQDKVVAVSPDSHDLIEKKGVLMVVCDGVGGMQGGQIAADVASRTALTAYYDEAAGDEPQEAMRYAIEQANLAVRDEAAQTPSAASMATTIVMIAVMGSRLYVANVGDSRAYLFHDGQLEQVSTDHSWVGEQVRLGAMTAAEARQSTMRNYITRSLGSAANNNPDFAQRDLHDGDRVVLCSDGIHGAVEDGTIAVQLARRASPGNAAQAILKLALANNTTDNATVAILDCGTARAAGVPLVPILAAVVVLMIVLVAGAWLLLSNAASGSVRTVTPAPTRTPAVTVGTAIIHEVVPTTIGSTVTVTVATPTMADIQATSTIAIPTTATATIQAGVATAIPTAIRPPTIALPPPTKAPSQISPLPTPRK